MNKNFFKSRALAFRYAFAGWGYVMRTQRNAWIHAAASVAVIGLGVWLGLSAHDWAIILIAISLVWIAEFMNTALEAVVNLASPKEHELARVGKDVSAAAVLIAAGSSVLIGLLILGPPLWEQLKTWFVR